MPDFPGRVTAKSNKTTKIILAKENEHLRRRASGWEAVGAMAMRLAGGDSLEMVLNDAVRECAHILRADVFCVMLLGKDGKSLDVRASVGLDTDLLRPIPISAPEGLLALSEQELYQLLLTGDIDGDTQQTEAESDRMVCLPLVFRNIPVGAICLKRKNGNKFEDIERKVIMAMSKQIAMAAFIEGPAHMMMLAERAERELHFAHSLKGELNVRPPEMDGWRFTLRSLQGLDVSGDFSDFVSLPGNRIAMVVGKSSGQGVKASLNVTRILFNIRGRLASDTTLEDLVAELNEDLIVHGRRGLMVNLSIAILDPSNRTCELIRAGSAGAYLSSEEDVNTLLDDSGAPLGVLSGHSWKSDSIALDNGGALVFMTRDASCVCDSNEEVHQEFANCLREWKAAEQPLANFLAACIMKKRQDAMQGDDITILSVECMPAGV